jgi:hypothetical protein
MSLPASPARKARPLQVPQPLRMPMPVVDIREVRM